MIPAALTTTLGLQRPLLEKVRDYIRGRIVTELAELAPIAVDLRLKSEESIYQKLQTGKYSGVRDLDDLIGLKIVMLYRHQVFQAQSIVAECGLTIMRASYGKPVKPTDFIHREPKLSVMPSEDYRSRNPEIDGIVAEVQFTTALQHALDMATHKFDYKGNSYSWENFRLVAQLRGMLELADTILDDLEKARMPSGATLAKPPAFDAAMRTLSVINQAFSADSLPGDLRRMTDTVTRWTEAADVAPEALAGMLSQHSSLVGALSIDPTSAVLGVLLREHASALLTNFEGTFCIGDELVSLCQEAAAVPEDRRVSFEWA